MVHKQYTVLIRYKHFFVTLLVVLVLSFFIIFIGLFNLINYLDFFKSNRNIHHTISLDLTNLPKVVVPEEYRLAEEKNPKCTHYDCFNVFKCGHSLVSNIKVYVYPLKEYVDNKSNPIAPISSEFYKILETVVKSKYYVANPEEACLFIPSIDTLNQNRFQLDEVSRALASLPKWNNGENHIIWNMLPGFPPHFNTVVDLNTGNAIIAGAGFDSWTYRVGFDVSIPVQSPNLNKFKRKYNGDSVRKWTVISSQLNIHIEYEDELMQVAAENSKLLVLTPCNARPSDPKYRCDVENKMYLYPDILLESQFCLVLRGPRLAQPTFLDALSVGCIPIVSADTMIMPFSEVIDWKRASLTLREADLSDIMSLASSISPERRKQMSDHCLWLYEKYFSSIEKITMTALDIINDRVFPQRAKLYEDWNNPLNQNGPKSPLFLHLTAPRSSGFTAVILTYDRVESLFTLIKQLVQVPSLQKVLVIWNNQRKSPPNPSAWPKITKPLKVIQTTENKLSNRFHPYPDIETEAILTIDDDIVMLTADEVEFGFEVWREFPDRIVGFPSRTHVWDNTTGKWKYESEWTNQISMVLTGAAFHHKYWSYLYTKGMPGDIKEWVDERMNCEDIAMNFLVANITGKAPIKVTPRKKFKCPECINTEMLSADLSHMIERSDCIDRFSAIYGMMPLKTVEFRADPVLFKDSFPGKLKRFNNIGSL